MPFDAREFYRHQKPTAVMVGQRWRTPGGAPTVVTSAPFAYCGDKCVTLRGCGWAVIDSMLHDDRWEYFGPAVPDHPW